jgi:hypothetical protein
MNLPRWFALLLVFPLTGSLCAETPEERAKKVTVTMTLTDVPPGAAAHFVEVVSKIKVHYQGHPGDPTLLTLNFENIAADEALKYIANLAKLELAYKADGAHFTPRK